MLPVVALAVKGGLVVITLPLYLQSVVRNGLQFVYASRVCARRWKSRSVWSLPMRLCSEVVYTAGKCDRGRYLTVAYHGLLH